MIDREIKKRYLLFLSLFIIIGILFVIRIYIIQVKYSTKQISNAYKGDIQKETISQKDFNVYDANDKMLSNINKRYVAVIDSNLFRFNNVNENLDNILILNYIMKSCDKNFSIDDVVSEGGKHYYSNLSEEDYLKILDIVKELKGLYAYEYEYIDDNKAWSIENLLSNIDDTGKELDSSYLESSLYTKIKDNVYNKIIVTADNYGCYNDIQYSNSENNCNIKTTLNKSWQDNSRKILQDPKFSDISNIGVAICDSETGNIKVLCQKDETQPNVILGSTGLGYPPGSIFKIVVEMAAMKNGGVDFSKTYTCTGRYCKKDGKPNPHGTVNFQQALRVSCNEYFMNLGRSVGFDAIQKTAVELNLGQPILSLSTESSGSLPTEEKGISNISIGQTFNVTPLQMLGVMNTVCNDGKYIKPNIIEGIEKNDGTVEQWNNSVPTNMISERDAANIRYQLLDVVNNGSGSKAKVDGVTIGGKTGTAEDGEYNDVWFMGYFKIKEKSYSAIIFIPKLKGKDKEGKLYGGGETAAPVFHDVVKKIIEIED